MRDYRRLLEQKVGQQKQVISSLESSRKNLENLIAKKDNLEKAQALIQFIAQATQEQLRYHISELISLALASVFEEPYEFDVDFVQRRNQVECDLWFVRDGNRISPMTASGGGAVNVAAFALRVACHALKSPKSRSVLILDEPFQNVKGEEANIKCIQMVKEVSKRLGLQVIMVSDERVAMKDIEEGADKVHTIKIKKGVSYVG